MVFPHLKLSKAEPMSVLEIKGMQLLGPWWSRLLSSDFPSYVPQMCSCYFCLKCRHFYRHMTCLVPFSALSTQDHAAFKMTVSLTCCSCNGISHASFSADAPGTCFLLLPTTSLAALEASSSPNTKN